MFSFLVWGWALGKGAPHILVQRCYVTDVTVKSISISAFHNKLILCGFCAIFPGPWWPPAACLQVWMFICVHFWLCACACTAAFRVTTQSLNSLTCQSIWTSVSLSHWVCLPCVLMTRLLHKKVSCPHISVHNFSSVHLFLPLPTDVPTIEPPLTFEYKTEASGLSWTNHQANRKNVIFHFRVAVQQWVVTRYR